jgi:hypothetical protein
VSGPRTKRGDLIMHRSGVAEAIRVLAACLANGLSLSCTARAHVPKPTRRGGCRQGVALATTGNLQPT